MVTAQYFDEDQDIEQDLFRRLSRDLVDATHTLGQEEARFLVDTYYQLQGDRIAADGRRRSLAANDEPHAVISWFSERTRFLEAQLKRALGEWSMEQRPGRWAQSIPGIGPVITAGLLAHIDITKAPSVGHIWRFAGLDPTRAWEKGEKRPWNADLKVLCWKAGESFVKTSNRENDVYGHIYRERKELEIAKNERGEYAETAAAILASGRYKRDTGAKKAYEEGKLPAGHLHARAKRYAVKLFLSHLHHVMYECHYGAPPPKPYILTRPEHTHFIAPPNWPCE